MRTMTSEPPDDLDDLIRESVRTVPGFSEAYHRAACRAEMKGEIIRWLHSKGYHTLAIELGRS